MKNVREDSLVLSLVGVDFWGHPVFAVGNTNTYVKDMNMGEKTPELYWNSPKDDVDGEPDYPFSTDKNIVFDGLEKLKKPEKTREEKKLVIAAMIAANQFKVGSSSVEWLDFASAIHDLDLTKELLTELQEQPMEMEWHYGTGWTKKEPPKIHVDNLVLEVTRRCNMTCRHCLRGPVESMDMDWHLIIDALEMFDSIGSVVFTGGEPTLNMSFISFFFEEAKRRNKMPQSFYIVTNGKENQLELAAILLKYYGEMEAQEMCGVALSIDDFHDAVNINYLRGLSFYDTAKVRPAGDNRWVVKEGTAGTNNIGHSKRAHQSFSIVKDDGQVELEQVYINAKGEIIEDCDLSYANQAYSMVTTLKELPEYIKQVLGESVSA